MAGRETSNLQVTGSKPICRKLLLIRGLFLLWLIFISPQKKCFFFVVFSLVFAKYSFASVYDIALNRVRVLFVVPDFV